MPELPEVETILRGIKPALLGKTLQKVIIRRPNLRWEIPISDLHKLAGHKIIGIERRAKYLLIKINKGTLIIHLGMSGCLRLYEELPSAQKHDHVDFIFNSINLRYTDPRRFGAILWTDLSPENHSLLKNLGPEPLDKKFNAEYLMRHTHNKKAAIKNIIMDSQIVVGVGNIYATEALFIAHIHPNMPSNQLILSQAKMLCRSIKAVLRKAIIAGGTTLKDFMSTAGKPGYFRHRLLVYGRENQPCVRCGNTLKKLIIGQRSTVYCSHCQ